MGFMVFSFSGHTRQGFTLMEIVVYIAIFSIVMVMAIGLVLNIVLGGTKIKSSQEVYSGARLAMDTITRSVRGADDVRTSSSTFGVYPGVLSLSYTDDSEDDVIVDTYTRSVSLPSGSTTIRTLRIKEGEGAYEDLTSSQVDVTNFVVRNLTRGTEQKLVNIELTIQNVNPGGDPDHAASLTLETSASIRR